MTSKTTQDTDTRIIELEEKVEALQEHLKNAMQQIDTVSNAILSHMSKQNASLTRIRRDLKNGKA